ncbi:MAG: hypothetical protein A2Y91_07385 [Chloroflexi bacterium RBG_13_54_8]|nr:MAG: hypothetical protein A2Y91_07385 [Chloroflexi bacterium RBG_13_54_8]
MKRLGIWTIGLLLVLLATGLAVPALAGSPGSKAIEAVPGSSSGDAEVAELAAELEVADAVADLEESGDKEIKLLEVTLGGGFLGVWGTDNVQAAEPVGKLAGVYGTVERADGTKFAFFRGIWISNDGSMFGYLKGRYADGQFKGTWGCPETGAGGSVEGTYTIAGIDNATAGDFTGIWTTRDGQQKGYLKGTWSPVVSVKREGRFGGRWTCGTAATSSVVDSYGRLWGLYGSIDLADGSSIHYFRGKWDAANDGPHGRLGGLIIDGRFYGLWASHNNLAGGYLKGVWAENLFKGVWGHFGSSAEGRLWGRYGPLPVPSPVEEQTSWLDKTE